MTIKGGLFRLWVRYLGGLGLCWPVTYMVARSLREVQPDGNITALRRSGDDDRITLLALTPDRFRDDLEILVGTGKFRVLRASYTWQGRLIAAFYPTEMDFLSFYNPEPGSDIGKRQTELRKYLRRLLKKLYQRVGIDGVIGAATHYQLDYDWGVASTQIGVPYIVFHRECYLASPGLYRDFRARWTGMGKFEGGHIIVYDENTKNCILESGYAEDNMLSSLGCLRMDKFVARIAAHESFEKPRKKVTLFSFNHGAGMVGLIWEKGKSTGFKRLFDEVHVAFARLAIANPEIDFVIKPKWDGEWMDKLDETFDASDINWSEIPNLSVLVDIDVHGLILESDVICGGVNSNTLLESALAGKPIVMPLFAEAEGEFADYVKIPNDLDIFDVAKSPDEFQSLIMHRLENPEIGLDCQTKRNSVFERYVSSPRGDATEKYVRTLDDLVAARL